MPVPPRLTDQQRQAALEKAVRVRRVRAEIKDQLKVGALSLAELLNRVPTDEVLSTTKVLVVLESLPGVGKVKARKVMRQIGIAESRRLAGLGLHQREALLKEFGG